MINTPLAFIILPLTGALIGYLTNFLALKLLFHPRTKTLGFQGVIPKNKRLISEKIAETSLNLLPKKLDELIKVPYFGKKIREYIKKEIALKVSELNDKELQRIIENTVKR